MRLIISLLLACYLPFAGASSAPDVQKQVTAFYHFYLHALENTPPDEVIKTAEMRQYVSAKLLTRIAEIYAMPEQELLSADYFTYTQDYDPAWIARLNVSPPQADGDSMRLDVWLGIEDNKHSHLQVWTRKEAGEWKIWRVTDVGEHFEQKLY
ncbi:DUF3828 domain-containing protein [Kosakonia cowanii]|uniref:DUF3828 domain-containing protein n=1 Tax=Kosakonia cowanii TaxID=208223 RepID=UPI0040640308